MKIRAMVFVACMPLTACAVLFQDVAEDKNPDPDQLQTARDSSMQNFDAGVIAMLDAGAFPESPDAEVVVVPPPAKVWQDEPGYVFVTNVAVDGRILPKSSTLRGVARGDEFCRLQAMGSPVEARVFRSYLSDDLGVSANARRFYNKSGWRFVPAPGANADAGMDPSPTLSTDGALWQGNVGSALTGAVVNRNQYGQVFAGAPAIWTGSTDVGGGGESSCDSWSMSSLVPRGWVNDGTFAHPDRVNRNCSQARRIVCIEVDPTWR